MPNCSLDDGLKKVYNDDECLEMGKLLMKSRSLDLYVVHGVDTPNVLHKLPEVIFDGHYVPVPKSPKKLIPRRCQSDNSNLDPGYAPDESTDSSESDGDGFVVDEELIEGEQSEREVIVENIEQADSNDDELREARQRVKLRNAELINIAEKLRRQIDEGTFASVKPTDGTEGRSDSSRREGDEACCS
ncbi:hypothetical protein BVRB_8g189740 [Beta vulgaris subsp. vulgaris]|nr:hypothetical protein BVRB_8g189740 [Beta vulgaris subsp. vulgaris]